MPALRAPLCCSPVAGRQKLADAQTGLASCSTTGSGQREQKLPSAHRTVLTGPYTAPHVTLLSIDEVETNTRDFRLTLSFAPFPG